MLDYKIIMYGGLACLLTVIEIIQFLRRKNKSGYALMFCSLSFSVLTVFEELKMVWSAYDFGEMSCFESTPETIVKVRIFVLIMISMNLIGLIIANVKKHRKMGGTAQ